MDDYEMASIKRLPYHERSKGNVGMCRIDDIFPVSSRFFFGYRGLA